MRSILKKLLTPSQAGKRLRKKGQTLVEYSLILVIITVVLIASLSFVGKTVVGLFSQITSLLDTAQSP